MPKRIDLKGPIISSGEQEVYDYYGIEAVSPKLISNSLPDDSSDVVIEVNSNGGLVTSGSEIYTTLARYEGNVTVEVVGMAASAASVAIMGADKVTISPTAQIMIHKAAFGNISGNSDDLEQAANALKSSDKSIVNAYKKKTGLSDEELLSLMKNQTFMSADEAIQKGFADEILEFENKNNVLESVASIGTGMLPAQIVNNYFSKQQNSRKVEIETLKNEIEKQEILNSL